MIFEFVSEEARQKFLDLIRATDGTEPCYDPDLLNPLRMKDSHTDQWVESYTGRHNMKPEDAAALCEGCHVLELCREYARMNKEPWGVWGGETPQQRGVDPRRVFR